MITYKNNTHVKDFSCESCKEEYQLKSSKDSQGKKIKGAQYHKLFESIKKRIHPSFIVLRYKLTPGGRKLITEIFAIHKRYIKPEMIICRNPLGPGTRREGWIGCIVDIRNVPESAVVWIYHDGNSFLKEDILKAWMKSAIPKSHKQKTMSSWTKDVYEHILRLPNNVFFLKDVYRFEEMLQIKHPENMHVRDKIRQQLQVLRDVGLLYFHGHGKYERIDSDQPKR